MPYLSVKEPTCDIRRQIAAARWSAILEVRPDLEPAVELQRRLIGSVVDLAAVIEQRLLPQLSPPPGYLAAKLARGVPMLAGESIQVPAEPLQPTLLRLCDQLAAGGAGDAARHIAAELKSGRIDTASLLTASLRRNQIAIREGAVHRGLAPDLLWLVAELAVSPFANALVQTIVRSADAALSEALAVWNGGDCPACGSWPALAEIESGHRLLRCSFCATAWELDRLACIYCGEQDAPFSVKPKDGSTDRRLELCSTCHGYLKQVDVTAPSPFPLLAIADLETMELDVAAMEGGFVRPPLKSDLQVKTSERECFGLRA